MSDLNKIREIDAMVYKCLGMSFSLEKLESLTSEISKMESRASDKTSEALLVVYGNEYKRGHADGYAEGFENGKMEGYEEGVGHGYSNGIADGSSN